MAVNFAQKADELLKNLPQAQAVSLMGFDGLAVATAAHGPLPWDVATLLTEYAQTLVTLRRAAQEVPEAGAPQDVVVHTTQAAVLLRPVHMDYYLAVVQHADAPMGRARFFMNLLAQTLMQEL
jgi:predicted regulator of Ras-like GTPase activity (Roadblock/LC7/MglB family)